MAVLDICDVFKQVDDPMLFFTGFQAYAFMVSCLLYRDANTSISSLEALHQLLVSTTVEMAVWLITPLPTPQVTTDFWTDGNANDTTSDTHSLGDVSSKKLWQVVQC